MNNTKIEDNILVHDIKKINNIVLQKTIKFNWATLSYEVEYHVQNLNSLMDWVLKGNIDRISRYNFKSQEEAERYLNQLLSSERSSA